MKAPALFLALLALGPLAPAAARGGVSVRITPPGAAAESAARTFFLKDLPQVEAASCRPLHQRPLAWVGLAPGLLALAAFWRRGRRGRRGLAALLVLPFLLALSAEDRAAVSAGVAAFVAGDHAVAEGHFAAAERAAGCNPALAYDRSLCSYALGRRAQALAALLRAIRADPGNAEYRGTFAALSAEYGLEAQALPSAVASPRLLFAAGLVCADAALAALGLLLGGRRGSWVIAFALLALACGAAAVLLVYDGVEAGAPFAVVAPESATLRRVPLEQAQAWMALPQGTTLRIRGRAGDFVLVETGLRVEGWLRRDVLLEPAAAR